MSVTFLEEDTSPQIRYSKGGFTIVRKGTIAWSDIGPLFLEVFGGFSMAGGTPVITPPSPCPGFPQAYPSDMSIDPLGVITDGTGGTVAGINQFPNATATITYTPLDTGNSNTPSKPTIPEGTFLQYQCDIGGEIYTTPGRYWQWQGGDIADDDVFAGIYIPTNNFTLRWDKVVSPPWDAINQARGKVNETEFMGFEAGHVLFDGAQTSTDFPLDTTGDMAPMWSLLYNFKAKAVPSTTDPDVLRGWNYFYNREDSGGEHWQLLVDSDGNHVYADYEFDNLFVYP